MKIIAINGSHRKGKNTANLLKMVLEEAAGLDASTELLELTDYDIKLCTGCNKCLRQPQCAINDDMAVVGEKLLAADGILLGSPVYWANVSALMKNFMDRTRYLHMVQNQLAGKAGGAVTVAGLRNGGQETALIMMSNFLQAHGLYVVDARDPMGANVNIGVTGSLMADFKDDAIIWRRNATEDELTVQFCKQLGRNMVKLIEQLKG